MTIYGTKDTIISAMVYKMAAYKQFMILEREL